MTQKIESALKRIETTAKTLNQSSDELSKRIADIESALNKYKLGLWVWLDKPILEEHESDESERYHWKELYCFGYGKLREKWGLLINVYPDYDPEPNLVFLKDAPREIRVVAIDRIPDLLERIAEEATKLNQRVMEKAELAGQIAAALNKTD
jgi:hypothetical protein